MTGETRTLATWGGAAGAVALIGLVWVLVRGASLGDDRDRIHQLAGDQAKAQPAGLKLEAQIAAVQKSAQEQAAALAQADKGLVPELKPEYRTADLTSAANRVATDLKGLRQRADRTRVALPASLPLESGLDPDQRVRELQLAQLSLYRTLLDLVMDAGITSILGVTPGESWADPTGRYAVLTADMEIEASFEGTQSLLQALLAAHSQGIGLRALAVQPGARADGPLHLHFIASLLTPSKPGWNLTPEKISALPAGRIPFGAAPPAPAAAPETKPAPGGN